MRLWPGSVLVVVVVGSLHGTDRVASAFARREGSRLLGRRICKVFGLDATQV